MSSLSPFPSPTGVLSQPLFTSEASSAAPLLNAIFRTYPGPPFSIRFWDLSMWHSEAEDLAFELVLKTQEAWRTLSSSPDDVSLGEKYITGQIDVTGDLSLALRALPTIKESIDAYLSSSGASVRRATHEFAEHASRLLRWGAIHSKRRDAASIAQHYDKPAEFYKLFLGSSMVYSCAYFHDWSDSLDTAQFKDGSGLSQA